MSFVSKAVKPHPLNRFHSNIDVRNYVLVSGTVCFKVLIHEVVKKRAISMSKGIALTNICI